MGKIEKTVLPGGSDGDCPVFIFHKIRIIEKNFYDSIDKNIALFVRKD